MSLTHELLGDNGVQWPGLADLSKKQVTHSASSLYLQVQEMLEAMLLRNNKSQVQQCSNFH